MNLIEVNKLFLKLLSIKIKIVVFLFYAVKKMLRNDSIYDNIIDGYKANTHVVNVNIKGAVLSIVFILVYYGGN
ncbi:hypothetical protein BL313_00525 [Staphylococcus hominis]|nr:hypothetical protein BL313_00525 [Staphylococcus hominis]